MLRCPKTASSTLEPRPIKVAVGLDGDICYRVLVARDERFDGLFFVAVKTTGIYCRPTCPARTPGRDRCVFYRTAAEAERDAFRACLRCRPELAPGAAPIDSMSRIVRAAVAQIAAGALNEATLDELSRSLGVTARHLRRAMQTELGVSPMQLAMSRRVSLAKQLLQDTAMPITDIAFASGFQSIRRFNATFRQNYARAPSQLRRGRKSLDAGTIALTLEYRPPLDWESILAFLGPRAVPGVELVRDGVYLRTVRLGAHHGWVAVSPVEDRPALRAEISPSLTGALMPLVGRLRRLFDLDAQPRAVAAHLAKDKRFADWVAECPGLRVPGAFDPFEAAVRAVLGQQITVAGATTLYSRLVTALGARIETPYPELTHLSPCATDVRAASEEALVSLGILRSRAATLRALATAAIGRGLLREPNSDDPEVVVDQLQELPGIGAWTAHYIGMRALGWPDAFPEGDLGIRRALGGVSAREARRLAEAWRPWRAYAVMHLWKSIS